MAMGTPLTSQVTSPCPAYVLAPQIVQCVAPSQGLFLINNLQCVSKCFVRLWVFYGVSSLVASNCSGVVGHVISSGHDLVAPCYVAASTMLPHPSQPVPSFTFPSAFIVGHVNNALIRIMPTVTQLICHGNHGSIRLDKHTL